MNGRISIFVVAIASLGLLSGAAFAQVGSQKTAYPASFATGGDNCADPGCAGTGELGCTDCADGSTDGWITSRRFKSRHNLNCSCPRCRPKHSWASFDALFFWGRGRSVPALVTTNPNSGVLPGAPVLFGDGTVGNRLAPGVRTDFGFWFDDCESLGMGARIWGVHGDSQGFFGTSPDGNTLLARPFYNVVADAEDSLLIAEPGLLTGNVSARTSSSVLGGEAYLRSSLVSGRGFNLDLLGGYHFVRLDDDLLVYSLSTSIDPGGAVAVGTEIEVLDVFDARNEFHGGQFGMVGEVRRSAWTFTSLAKLSVGNMRQTVTINGHRSVTPPAGASVVTPGGLLTQPTNIGVYTRDKTTWIPELSLNAAYQVRNWMRLTIGYNVIWFSNVALSGDQIDTLVNRTQFGGGPLIGPPRPAYLMRDTEYWLHGLTLGATLTY